MDQRLSALHPNPGWVPSGPASEQSHTNSLLVNHVGNHCIHELYECNYSLLNDEVFIRTLISTAAKCAGAKLLKLITHRFKPQGVTGLALLAESHISIHTWPENGYAAVDVFTCGDHTMPEQACEVLRKELLAKRHSLRRIRRQTPAELMHASRKPI